MKDYIYLILIITCLASCTYNQIVDARINKVIYSRIHELGYRKMPRDMYFNWLYSLNEHSNEYRTKKIVIYNNSMGN